VGLYLALLKAVGKAALNAVGGVAGDGVVDVLPEVAQKVREWSAPASHRPSGRPRSRR
jgi:hypothetical protein